MANQDKIFSHVTNNLELLPRLFSYRDVAGVALDILNSSSPGVDYAVLKFLQLYCIQNEDIDDKGFFIGDPRKCENLSEVKNAWIFRLKNGNQSNIEAAMNKSTVKGKVDMVIRKRDYLDNLVVQEFIKHLRGLLTTAPFEHIISPSTSNKKNYATWKCKNLTDALKQYCWNNESFDRNNQVLLGLSNKLKVAVGNSSEMETLRLCMKILSWGGVRNGAYGITEFFLENALATTIKNAANELTADTVDLAFFSNVKDESEDDNSGDNSRGETNIQHLGYRMNASFTKIYSLYSDKPFIIYDSRVAAALGLITRLYWEGKYPGTGVNDLLCFSFLEGRSNGSRDASFGHVKFKKITTGRDHAFWNVRANWIIEEALREIEMFAGKVEMQDKMRAVEAALFMIGKNVKPL